MALPTASAGPARGALLTLESARLQRGRRPRKWMARARWSSSSVPAPARGPVVDAPPPLAVLSAAAMRRGKRANLRLCRRRRGEGLLTWGGRVVRASERESAQSDTCRRPKSSHVKRSDVKSPSPDRLGWCAPRGRAAGLGGRIASGAPRRGRAESSQCTAARGGRYVCGWPGGCSR